MSTYQAINVVTGQRAEFKFHNHMGEKKIVDKKTNIERSITIRDVAEDAMEQAFGKNKVHGWSVNEKPGSDYWEQRRNDPDREPFQTL